MPEFKLPTVKLRGFREMNTDDIKSALSDVPKPDVKLADIADAAIAATQAATKAAQDAAAAAQAAALSAAERAPVGNEKRSRRPLFVLGIVVASLGFVALANADRIRGRLSELGQRARERMDANRVSDSLEQFGSDEEAFTGAVGIPIQSDAFADSLPSASDDLTPQPAGFETTAYGEGGDVETPLTQEDAAEVYRG